MRTRLAKLRRRPKLLFLFTLAYLAWSLVPVLLAVRFSFNEGRSRSSAQGWSTHWYWGDPDLSVWHDPDLRSALFQSLRLAGFAIAIAVPLGVALALGITRWRGRAARPANLLALSTLVTPEIVMGSALLTRLRQPAHVHAARDTRPAHGPRHVLAGVRAARRARPSRLDRPGVRGGGHGPRRLVAQNASLRAPAAALARDRGERDRRVRALDGRLRGQRVPLGRLGHGYGSRPDLLQRARLADARPERAREPDPVSHARGGGARLRRLAGGAAPRRRARLGGGRAGAPRALERYTSR